MKICTLILCTCILLLIGLSIYHTVPTYHSTKEGFASSTQSNYEALQNKLKSTMATYCDLASFVQKQMKTIYMSTKMSDDGKSSTPGETEQQANAHIQQTYRDVYACKDELASSRQSCGGILSILKPQKSIEDSDVNPGFVSCDNYMNLPNWPDETGAVVALGNIPNTLADRVSKEVDWYATIIKKLADALEMGNTPPPNAPDTSKSPSTDTSGKTWSSGPEGFADATCSPAAAQAKRELLRKKQLEDQAAKDKSNAESCSLASLDSEITRINGILDSKELKAAISKCELIKAAMIKLQSDQKKAAEGTLYEWQKDGPKKSYEKYTGGDRTAAFLFSMKQNQ